MINLVFSLQEIMLTLNGEGRLQMQKTLEFTLEPKAEVSELH